MATTHFRGSPGETSPDQTPRCPDCGSAWADQVYCPRDGQVMRGPFSLADRYWIHQRVGAGATSWVYAAQHRVLGKPVAVKVLRPDRNTGDEADRFLRAARLSSRLSHENIVTVHDFGEDNALGMAFVVWICCRAPRWRRVSRRAHWECAAHST